MPTKSGRPDPLVRRRVGKSPGRKSAARTVRNGESAPTLEMVDRHRPRTERRFVAEVVAATLESVGRPELEVSLLLTDEREIARIHRRHLGLRSATDVLSFSVDGRAEIVISVERARRQARRMGHTIRAEIALYIMHGILHLCGHDDKAPRERRAMRAAEEQILSSLGLRITPVDG